MLTPSQVDTAKEIVKAAAGIGALLFAGWLLVKLWPLILLAAILGGLGLLASRGR